MSATAVTKPATTSYAQQTLAVHALTVAVSSGFILRVFLCWFGHFAEGKFHFEVRTTGQESAFVAWALASGKGFANPFPHYEAATGWLAPVFPALWSIAYRFFNPETSKGGIYFCQVMNSAFSALTCWPIYWLGKRLFTARIGLAATWTWALLPLAILFPLEWTWDQSLSALVLGFVLWATYRIRDVRADSLAWSAYGCLWGFTALVNPTLCVVLPFLLAWLAYSRSRVGATWTRPLLRCVLLFVLAVLPWTLRNYFVLDGFMFIKSNFGLELWLGNNPDVPADNVYASQLNPMTNRQQLLELAVSGEPGYMRAKQRAALSFIRSHPGVFGKLVLRRVLDTWTGWYDAHIDKWIVALHLSSAWIIFCAVFSAISAVGLILGLRKNLVEVLPLALCAILIPVPYYITHSSLRYRHPIDPILTIFATYAVTQVYPLFRSRFTRNRTARPVETDGITPAGAGSLATRRG